MYQVTYTIDDCEIGYGEGESIAYAREEARESIDSFYRAYIASGAKVEERILIS